MYLTLRRRPTKLAHFQREKDFSFNRKDFLFSLDSRLSVPSTRAGAAGRLAPGADERTRGSPRSRIVADRQSKARRATKMQAPTSPNWPLRGMAGLAYSL